MRATPNEQLAKSKRHSLSLALLLVANCLSLACSVPNLEQPECTESRNIVREFYSFHFGNDMKFSQENLKLRAKFLTPAFLERLNGSSGELDPFTSASDFPKAFRVGECAVSEPGRRTDFEVLLFWKTNERSEQKHVHATAVKDGDRWLIDNVTP